MGECLVDDFFGNCESKLKVEGGHGNITNLPECARTYNYKSFFGIFVKEIVFVSISFKVSLQFFPLLLKMAWQLVIYIIK